eukprot:TRINITY_DN18579_c0_g1_i1.p1 TRINITY_DN18579_c0_g1~~TRINITY_DN18579_c0_g1_i1.p1  ORF type:complete len:468 (-),score=144.96 TRINITY_DN18579_c0_g1_i1:262-1665(-)
MCIRDRYQRRVRGETNGAMGKIVPPEENRESLLELDDYHLDQTDPFKDSEEGLEHEGNGWFQTTFLIMASIVGVGVLGLPHNFQQVGWLMSITFLLLGAYSACYSGILFHDCWHAVYEATGRRVTSFPDLGAHVWGEQKRWVFDIIGYLAIILGMMIQQLVLTQSLQAAFKNSGGDAHDFCLYEASGVIAVIMLCFSQVRSLEELGWTAVFGVSSIAVPIVIVFVHAATHPTYAGDDVLFNHDTPWDKFLSNLVGGVVFAYAGQTLFPNFMASMADPRDFPKCVYGSSIVMTVIYATVAVLGYVFLGDKVQSPVTNDLGEGWASVTAEVVLIFHVVVGYAVSANVFNGFIFSKVFPEEDLMGSSFLIRLKWFSITVGSIALAFVVANVIPVFSDFVNLYGSSLGVLITYHFPSIMYLKLCSPSGWALARVRMFMLLGTGLFCAGTLGSAVTLGKAFGKNGVFPCVDS